VCDFVSPGQRNLKVLTHPHVRGHLVCDEGRLKFALEGAVPQQAITRFLSIVGSLGTTNSTTTNSSSWRTQRLGWTLGSLWRYCWWSAGV